MIEEIELDCRLDFEYDEDYQDVVFANVGLSLVIPRTQINKFKLVPYKEWDKAILEVFKNKMKEGTTEVEKCCETCKNEVPSGNYTEKCHGCIRSKQYQDPSGCIDNWEPKENK